MGHGNRDGDRNGKWLFGIDLRKFIEGGILYECHF